VSPNDGPNATRVMHESTSDNVKTRMINSIIALLLNDYIYIYIYTESTAINKMNLVDYTCARVDPL
jgi:hypothetical protein